RRHFPVTLPCLAVPPSQARTAAADHGRPADRSPRELPSRPSVGGSGPPTLGRHLPTGGPALPGSLIAGRDGGGGRRPRGHSTPRTRPGPPPRGASSF